MKPGPRHAAAAAVAAGLLLLLGLSAYTVDAREVAVVLSFGKPIRTVVDPGLYFRAPWPLHDVVRFDRRARVLEAPSAELLTKDKKNLVVEPFALWRVADPQRFLEAFRSAGVALDWASLTDAAEVRLSDLVTSRISTAIGQQEFAELLSLESAEGELLATDVVAEVAATAQERFGIAVLDVRLRHVGLPLQNEQSIYERMRAERLRIANAYRSEGEEQATTIRARADRQAAEILAEADKEAARILAEAEAAAARIHAEAYREDPDFYTYLRSLDAMRAILTGDGTNPDAVIVLDSEGDLFQPLTRSPR